MEISGVIKSIPFYKPETGYGVFKTDQGTITGHAQNAGIGKHDVATLNWTHSLKLLKEGVYPNESRETQSLYSRI